MPYTAAEVNRGSVIVLSALGLSLLTELGSLMYALITNGPLTLCLMALVVTGWVGWTAYTGQLWARMAFSLFALMGGGWLCLLGFSLPEYILLLPGLAFVISGVTLWLPVVGGYFEYVQGQID